MNAEVASGVTVCRKDKGDLALHAYLLESAAAPGNDPGQIDVVFVHGLTGHALKTWDIRCDTSGAVLSGWIAGLASQLAGRARLWAVGYPAPLFADGKASESLQGTGAQALHDLCALGLGEGKLIFVAHSLGGVLIKSVLCEAMKADAGPQQRLLKNTHAVIFAGTPHAGSNLTKLRGLIPWITKAIATGAGVWLASAVGGLYLAAVTVGIFALQLDVAIEGVISAVGVPLLSLFLASLFTPSRQLLALDPDNPALYDLTGDFRRVAAKFAFRASAFFERRRVWRLFTVVPRSSADPGLTNCRLVGIDGDHISMCKGAHAGPLAREIEHQVKLARRGVDSAVFEETLGFDAEMRRKLAPLFAGATQVLIKKFADAEGDRARAEQVLRSHIRQLIARGGLDVDPLTLELARASQFDADVFVWQVWQEQRVMSVRRALRNAADEVVATWPASWQQKERPTLIPFYRAMRTIEHIYRGDITDVPGRLAECAELATLISRAQNELNAWCPSLHGVIEGRSWALDGDAGTRRLLLRMQCTLEVISATCKFFERETSLRYNDIATNATQLEDLSRTFRQALDALESHLAPPKGPAHPSSG